MTAPVESSALAKGLAVAFGQVVPGGFHVSAEGGLLTIKGSSGWTSMDVGRIFEQPGDPKQHVEAATYAALSQLQDFIAEELHTPWPGRESRLPQPMVTVSEEGISLWFQDGNERVLELPAVKWLGE